MHVSSLRLGCCLTTKAPRLSLMLMLLPLPLPLLLPQVWSVVSLINYRFVPLQFRVLFANIVALFW